MQGYFNKGKVVTPQCGITTSDIDKSAEIHILKTLDFTVLAQYRQIISGYINNLYSCRMTRFRTIFRCYRIIISDALRWLSVTNAAAAKESF